MGFLDWLGISPRDEPNLLFVRASPAVTALVDGHSTSVSARTFACPCAGYVQLLPVFAGIDIPVRIIDHVFMTADICPVFSGFRDLIVGRLDIGYLPVFLNEQVVPSLSYPASATISRYL